MKRPDYVVNSRIERVKGYHGAFEARVWSFEAPAEEAPIVSLELDLGSGSVRLTLLVDGAAELGQALVDAAEKVRESRGEAVFGAVRKICAWCKSDLGPHDGERTSHGICPKCKAAERLGWPVERGAPE